MRKNFYSEFCNYIKAKKDLEGRKKEDCPISCLRGYERREKIIFDFENKYLTTK